MRREIAIALRFQEGPQANQIWARLAERLPENDRWYLEALGIGADNYPDARFAFRHWHVLLQLRWRDYLTVVTRDTHFVGLLIRNWNHRLSIHPIQVFP